MPLIDSIADILQLQSHYSPANTPHMQRRGELVRHSVPALLMEDVHALRQQIGMAGNDVSSEGRSATGLNSEVPWVRLFSISRSPNPQTGWYCVLLFAADGAGFYLTVGHGSTRWDGGQFRPRSDSELAPLVAWARSILWSEARNDPRMSVSIDLRFRRSKVADSYQRGTAFAIWYAREALPEESSFREDIRQFARMLGKLYDAEDLGQTPDRVEPAIRDQLALAAPSPRIGLSGTGQGYGRMTQAERTVVEERAMRVARAHLEELGFVALRDTSRTECYDYAGARDGEPWRIEVKGTTSFGQSVLMTANEVDLHRSDDRTALVIVHGIELSRGEPPRASGGIVRSFIPFNPGIDDLKPLTFEVRVTR